MDKDKEQADHMNVMTPQIWNLLITSEAPHRGFKFLPMEGDGCLLLVVSLNNLAEFSHTHQEDLALWISGLCQKVRDMGVPCFIERSDNLKRRGK